MEFAQVMATFNFRKLLFSTGIISVIFYIFHIVLGSFLWPDYNNLQQPISDLTASQAPNRFLLLAITTIYGFCALIFALAFTFLESKKHIRLVFIGGLLFISLHILSISYGIFPEDLPGSKESFSGFMHLVVTALIAPITILTPVTIGLGFLKDTFWKRFGVLSILAGILIFLFGGFTAYLFIHKLAYFGLVERINIGILQTWTFLLSYKLINL